MKESQMEDILQEIPDDELYELRDMYKNFQNPSVIYSYIDILINWRKQAPEEFDVTFFTPYGNWRCDGTFIAFMQVCTIYSL